MDSDIRQNETDKLTIVNYQLSIVNCQLTKSFPMLYQLL